MSWTDERVALLTKLWGDGKTAAEIAKELGGVTRNAVIGKAHRLKLSNRVSPIAAPKKPKVVKKAQNQNQPPKSEKKPPRSVAPKPDEKVGGIALTDLGANQCRWPQGDPKEGEFGFCGAACMPGLPYCEAHVAIAYQPATRNRILQSQKTAAKAASNIAAQAAASAGKKKKAAGA